MAQQAVFAIGDLVKIKSGGPVMTVKAVWGESNFSYDCQWFAGKKLEVGRFPEASIVQVETAD